MNATRRVTIASLLLAAVLAAGCSSQPKRLRMPDVPDRAEMSIDPRLQQLASDEIAKAFASPDRVLRAQSLEAMSRTNDPRAAEMVIRAMADKEWIVRFAATMCAGDLKLAESYRAVAKAAFDDNANVRVGARYALHRLGDYSLSKELEVLSQNPDPRVRANVAMVLGLLKEPTGTRLVRPMLSDPDEGVRLAAAESLWALGDQQGLRNLVAGTISKFPDEQIVCTLALARPRDLSVKEYVTGKLAIDKDGRQYVELQLAAARALGMLNDDSGFGVAAQAAKSGEPRQRSMAALALGAIGRPDAQPTLAKLIADPKPDVRLAAATAVRQLQSGEARADAR